MKKQSNVKISTLTALIIIALSVLWQYFFQDKLSGKHTQNYDQSIKQDTLGANKTANVDYYMLALSWSPGFCEEQERKKGNNLPESLQYQCNSQQQFGWVVHGLWPQSKTAKQIEDHPRYCQGDLPMLPQSLLEQYLTISPGLNLLQGEWEKHGACAFKTAKEYFDKEKELYSSLKLPTKVLNRSELFAWLKQNNPQLKGKYLNATKSELFICYDLSWNVINCP